MLSQTNGAISLQGIVLAGLVIGALGVLADMGVTQASAVMALRRANPTLSAVALYRGGVHGRPGPSRRHHPHARARLRRRDAPAAAGSAHDRRRVADALNTQDIAEPVIATLVGSMALLVSVPLTTALAAALVHRVPAAAIPSTARGSHHH